MLDSIKHILARLSTRQLAGTLLMFGFVPIVIVKIISPSDYAGTLAECISILLLFFFSGLASIPIIVRREWIIRGRAYGWQAVTLGIVWLIMNWGIIIIAVINSLGLV